MNDLAALNAAARLARFGVVVRSVELQKTADAFARFAANGGNRAMRRAATRKRREGR